MTEPNQSSLERQFGLAAAGTSVRTELIAGLTTFLTMVYILFVNPIILGNAGMDKGAVFVATCVAAAVSTLMTRSSCAMTAAVSAKSRNSPRRSTMSPHRRKSCGRPSAG